MNRRLVLTAAALTLPLAAVTALALPSDAGQPDNMEPISADVIDWQQSCYAANCSTWVDETVTGTTVHITEDDPRWDCATMGNRVCGHLCSEDCGEGITFVRELANAVTAWVYHHRPAVAAVSVPLACDHEQCSTDPSEISGVTR